MGPHLRERRLGHAGPDGAGRLPLVLRRFRDAVRGTGERPVDPLDSVRGLRVMEAAEESARTGAAVTVSEV